MDQNQLSPTPPIEPRTYTPAAQTPPAPAIPALPKQADKFLPPAHGGSWGAFFGIVIIVIVLVVGALYFWGMQLEKQEVIENAGTEEVSSEQSTLSDFDTGLNGFDEKPAE